MDANDQGHRYGNFTNYYAFHPPQNRLQVLEQTNILNYIRDGLLGSSTSSDGSSGTPLKDGRADAPPITADGAPAESTAERPRIEKTTGPSQPRSRGVIYYCDLGCNEGDLTMAVAASLATAGDEPKVTVRSLGLDLDPVLVGRASAKSRGAASDPAPPGRKPPPGRGAAGAFEACDLGSESEHNAACASFRDGAGGAGGRAAPPGPHPLFHLTTVFSTTMWIHLHGGDDGLRAFVERACGWTARFLLVEPQPSPCYRRANKRLRRMGRPEIEGAAPSRLTMRRDVEGRIGEAAARCGFRRVTPACPIPGPIGGAVTPWNRTMCLYERVVGGD